jgi:hypothetical protein
MSNFRITENYAFVFKGDDGDEGVPAFLGPNNMVYPMIAADVRRLKDLIPMAEEFMKDKPGRVMRLLKFSNPEQVASVTHEGTIFL